MLFVDVLKASPHGTPNLIRDPPKDTSKSTDPVVLLAQAMLLTLMYGMHFFAKFLPMNSIKSPPRSWVFCRFRQLSSQGLHEFKQVDKLTSYRTSKAVNLNSSPTFFSLIRSMDARNAKANWSCCSLKKLRSCCCS